MYKLAEIKEKLMGYEFTLVDGLAWGISELIIDDDTNHAIVFDKRDTVKNEDGTIEIYGYVNIVDVEESDREIFSFWIGYQSNGDSDFAKVHHIE